MNNTININLDIDDAVPNLDDLAIDKIWTRFTWAKEESDAAVSFNDIVSEHPAVADYAAMVESFYQETQLIEQSVLASITDKYVNRIEKVELTQNSARGRDGVKIYLRNEYNLTVTLTASCFGMSSLIKFAGKTLYQLATPFNYDTLRRQSPLTVAAVLHHHFDLLAAKAKAFNRMVETFKEEALV